jgi:hypothetical protein
MMTAKRRRAQGGTVVKLTISKRTFVTKEALPLLESLENNLQWNIKVPKGTSHQTVQSFNSSLRLAQAHRIHQTANNRKRRNKAPTIAMVAQTLLFFHLLVPAMTAYRAE